MPAWIVGLSKILGTSENSDSHYHHPLMNVLQVCEFDAESVAFLQQPDVSLTRT